jgi:hypothetical protein
MEKSYKMHEDEHVYVKMCGERERRVGGEDEEECKVVAKMNSSCEMDCVLIVTEHEMKDALCIRRVRINIKVVPEIHFAALLQLKAPVRTISVESTLALNP